MAEKNGFDTTKLIFQMVCVWQFGAMVKQLLAPAGEPGSTPGDDIFCFFSLYHFFFCLGFVFKSYFSFWPVFLYS